MIPVVHYPSNLLYVPWIDEVLCSAATQYTCSWCSGTLGPNYTEFGITVTMPKKILYRRFALRLEIPSFCEILRHSIIVNPENKAVFSKQVSSTTFLHQRISGLLCSSLRSSFRVLRMHRNRKWWTYFRAQEAA